ncbi:MAG: hypothetical protein KBE09_05275 [Candidatus Pacebacteria bacterium]|nr:hypothetical protein [Candidatus Paceibacterota bacterium]
MYTLSLKADRPVISPRVPLSAARLIAGDRAASPHARFVFALENARVLSRLLQAMRAAGNPPVLDITHNGTELMLGLAVVMRMERALAGHVFGQGSHLFARENDVVLKVSAPLSREDEDVYLARATSASIFTVIALELADACGNELQLWAGEAPFVAHAARMVG